MIKAIIFDNFGVLTTDTWRAFVDSLPNPEMAEKAREINRQYDAALLSTDEFLQQVFKLTGQKPKQVEDMLDNEITKNTALLDYIRELKQQYKIGMLSNIATNWIRDSFLTQEEQALFDDMVFSFEVRVVKPDPRIFQLAWERLGVEPSEAVMIDDVERNVTVAREQGMQGITYVDLPQLKRDLEAVLSNV